MLQFRRIFAMFTLTLGGIFQGPYKALIRALRPIHLAEFRALDKDKSGAKALQLLTDRVLQQVSHAEQWSSSLPMSVDKKSSTPTVLHKRMAGTDTPCKSQALCTIDSLIANKCSYMRKGMQLAYQGLNVVVHVMGALITALCGCLYVLTQARCILSTVPPICIRPYSVYAKAFSGSVQMWESVKSTTKTCILHGSPLISS